MDHDNHTDNRKHIFIVGSKSIGQYGGYETFVSRLLQEHRDETEIQYHVAVKANGDGYMDESKLDGVEVLSKDRDGNTTEFMYNNAHVYKIKCPNIGPAVAIYYDCAALRYGIDYCIKNQISSPVFYVLASRIGPFIGHYKRQISRIGGRYYLNPDGHEWKRAKWSLPVRKYWKFSEKLMVRNADLVICDSVNIEKYILESYSGAKTEYIAYGADMEPCRMPDDDPAFTSWLEEKGLKASGYYLIVGRFVPENNYETMIREFMKSHSGRDLAIITNMNDKLEAKLEKTLHFSSDPRIKFVGTVYDSELLKKIRENAYGYLHGHEVGGTNPSLLEAMGSTGLNLLLDVGFNREVGLDTCLYWEKDEGNLSSLIDTADRLDNEEIRQYGEKARERIRSAYSWKFIADRYMSIWRA